MSDEANAPVGGEVASAAPANTPASDAPLTVLEAAEAYASRRQKEPEQADGADAAATDPKLADKANTAPVEEQATGETQEADPAEKPPIEPPRSWTKEAKERWNALPPETQEYLAQREQERDREVRRSQNETAEKLKGLSAKEQEVERVRQEYEAKLPSVMQMLQEAQAGAFPDIRNMDDVTRLANEDPFRYLQWQAHQQKLQAVSYEMEKSQERQTHEHQTKWAEYVNKENALVAEKLPEFADKAKAAELQSKAVDRLTDLGFTQSELADLASGREHLSIYDHRIQLLIADSLKLAGIQQAKAAVAAKPVPQVQRPGVAQPKGAAADANVQALSQRLTSTGSVKDAFALYQAKRKAG